MINIKIKLESKDGEEFKKSFSMPDDFQFSKNQVMGDIIDKYIRKCNLEKDNIEKCEIRAKFEW
jgi:hypothetical protein